MMKTLKFCCLVVLMACLSACGITSTLTNLVAPKGTRLDWSNVTLVAPSGANQNTPIAVDVVLLRDEAPQAVVAALSAPKWFASRTDLAKSFPEGLTYRSLEIAPGQTLKLPGSSFGSPRVVGVLLFADYLAPGEHRLKVEQLQGELVVQLGARSFSVVGQKSE